MAQRRALQAFAQRASGFLRLSRHVHAPELEHFLPGVTIQPASGIVHVKDVASFLVNQENRVTRRRKDAAVLVFALAQRFLGLLAFVDFGLQFCRRSASAHERVLQLTGRKPSMNKKVNTDSRSK
jgi:hypothetical protein